MNNHQKQPDNWKFQPEPEPEPEKLTIRKAVIFALLAYSVVSGILTYLAG